MRTRTYRTALLSTLLLAGCTPRETMPELTDRVFAVAAAQYEQLEGRLTDETLPRSAASDGKFIPSNIRWWCSGFYPGSLWYIYEYTGDKTFRELAEKNTFKLYPLKQKGTDHDLGFQMNCSFGNAYRITGEQKYLEPIHTSARVLAGRFSPVTGVIRSWDFVRKGRDWKYPVIIDNMMNLEHLYNAGLLFGDDTLKSVAVTHANTTLCNHFRPRLHELSPGGLRPRRRPRPPEGDRAGLQRRIRLGAGTGLGALRLHDDVPPERLQMLPQPGREHRRHAVGAASRRRYGIQMELGGRA